MDSIVVQLDPSTRQKCLEIQDDQEETTPGPDCDLIIGPNVGMIITIPNGASLSYRDAIVFGQLTIQSKDIKDTANRASIIFRDNFIAGGDIKFINLKVSGRNQWIGSKAEFSTKLQFTTT